MRASERDTPLGRRLDLALRGRGTVELTPDLFRYARRFWPTWRQTRKGL